MAGRLARYEAGSVPAAGIGAAAAAMVRSSSVIVVLRMASRRTSARATRYAVDNPMIEHQAHRTTLVGTDHSIGQKHRRHGDRMDEFGIECRHRRHHESSEIVAALPPGAKAKPPKQPTQRPRQFRNGKHAAEVPDLVQRRLFGVADHLRKIADAAGRRILDHRAAKQPARRDRRDRSQTWRRWRGIRKDAARAT